MPLGLRGVNDRMFLEHLISNSVNLLPCLDNYIELLYYSDKSGSIDTAIEQ